MPKMSVNLPDEDVKALREMAQRHGVTLTQALRAAIRTEKFIQEHDARVFVDDPKRGGEVRVVFQR